jgi:homocysteine S-methyltransferase
MSPTTGARVDPANPFAPFLDAQGVVILDGGLATTLEARGHSLGTRLWSARLLVDAPDAIRDVHRAYLEAGADCISTASYQATFAGFSELGIDHARAAELILRSVTLAVEARDAFWQVPANRVGRLRPLVAASVGPYGAYLADGSEYVGRYAIGEPEILAFHDERFRLLAASEADVIAFETVPSLPEALALTRLLDGSAGAWAWLSFTCRDGRHLADGTRLADAARACAGAQGLVAAGVNCVPPGHVPALVAELRSVTNLPIAVYPNSGEVYDATLKTWTGPASVEEFETASGAWVASGATLVGGCCRVGPEQIRALRRRLVAA